MSPLRVPLSGPGPRADHPGGGRGHVREEAADLRSEDPLDFFDVRPYPERLVEAELGTGLGDAMIIGRAAIEERPCELAVMDFSFMGGSMGGVVGEKFNRAAESAIETRVPLISITASGGAHAGGILSLGAARRRSAPWRTFATPAAASSA